MFKIHEIRFEINILTSDMEDLIAEKQLFVAAELNEKISDLHKKLAELQAPMPVEEVSNLIECIKLNLKDFFLWAYCDIN